MEKILLGLFLQFFILKINAQVSYTVNQIPYQNSSTLTGTIIPISSDDVFSEVITLPFTFNFFGNNYNHLVVSSNGSLNFDTTFASSISPWNLPNASIPDVGNSFLHNSILAPYTDLDINTASGYLFYYETGIAPYRKIIFSFYNIPMFTCTSLLYYSQIILHETSWEIDVNIYNKPLCANWNSGNSILGIQNIDGTKAYYPANKNGNSQWSVFQNCWRFSPSNGGPLNYSTISGRVYKDINNNCVYDANDLPVTSGLIRELNNNFIVGLVDTNGMYSFSYPFPIGTYTLGLDFNFGLKTVCPSNGLQQVSITSANQNITNIDFGMTEMNCVDFDIEMDTTVLLSCIKNKQTITIINTGFVEAINPFLKITTSKNSYLSDFKASLQNNLESTKLNDSVYLIKLYNISPTGGSIVSFNDSIPCVWNIENEITTYKAEVYDSIGNCDSINNTFEFYFKTENFSKINNLKVKRELYNPSFKNIDSITSNEWATFRVTIFNPYYQKAQNISIDIPFDTSKFDFFSYKILSSSHPVNDIYLGNHLVFEMKDVLLNNLHEATNNNSFVEFKIRMRSPIPLKEIIKTEAFITLSNQEMRKTDPVTLLTEPDNGYWFFPNPIEDEALIYFPEILNEALISMYDLSGKKVFSSWVNDRKFVFKKPEGMASGLYIFHLVEDNKIIYHNKVIVK